VQVFEDKQNGSLPSRSLKDSANCIRDVKPNRFVARDGRAVEGKSLTQLWKNETEIPRSRRERSLYVGRPIFGKCAKSLGPGPVRRRPFEVARSTPEDACASGIRSGREYLGKRRLADSCLTGGEHDLSASAERAIKRAAQL
jgi:hypothetical protein